MRLFKKKSTAEQLSEKYDLSDKVILITGCNSGLGFEAMRVLALRGAKVFALAATIEKATKACAKIKGNVVPLACELTSLRSIERVVSKVNEPLDIIIANAGVMALQEKVIVHGFEKQMFVNHMGHALLINQLIGGQLSGALKEDGRVIILASGAHSFARGVGIDFNDLSWSRAYKPWVAYGQSKLANILYTKALSRRLSGAQTINCLHPGIIKTPLWRHLPKDSNDGYTKNLKCQSVEEGAATMVFLAINEQVKKYNGEYFTNGLLGKPSALAQDYDLSEKLWSVTKEFEKSHFKSVVD